MNEILKLNHEELVFLKWCVATVKGMPKDDRTQAYVDGRAEQVANKVFTAIQGH